MENVKTGEKSAYRRNLRAANMEESRHPEQAVKYLKKCVEILENEPKLSPFQQRDFDVLVRRIIYIENRLKKSQPSKISVQKSTRTANTPENENGTELVQSENLQPDQVLEQTLIEDNQSNDSILETNSISESAFNLTVDSTSDSTLDSISDSMVESTSHSTLASEFSSLEDSNLFSFPKISPLPDIVDEVYHALLKDQSLEYDDYLTLFESVNDLYPDPIPSLIQQDSEVAFYIGDTHGSIKDTQNIIRYFDRLLSRENTKRIKIIFLGDYVDRNPNDLENLSLIVAFWLRFPENVVILRGNHEDMKINQFYGFLQNLQDTFPIEDWVKNLYQEILTFFMKLPIIHINNLTPASDSAESSPIRIFAVHAGIPLDPANPKKPLSLDQVVSEINPQVSTYEQFDTYMNWLLWADPKEEVDEIALLPDIGRNQFGQKPFDRFMLHNNLQFMVRAHEVLREGFKYFFNQRLISLFSASIYKNRSIGKAAFLRLEVGKSPVLLSTDIDMLEMDLEYWK
ncbi:MAG: metallophosphoesterase family protein [Promethearchaeota archaeon]